jgi:hypothetical protein
MDFDAIIVSIHVSVCWRSISNFLLILVPMSTSPPVEEPEPQSAQSMTSVFVWIAAGAILFGGLPYLYPSGST